MRGIEVGGGRLRNGGSVLVSFSSFPFLSFYLFFSSLLFFSFLLRFFSILSFLLFFFSSLLSSLCCSSWGNGPCDVRRRAIHLLLLPLLPEAH